MYTDSNTCLIVSGLARAQNIRHEWLTPDHREITLIELQSLVVFCCAALLFMVGATSSTHDRIRGVE